MKEKLLAFLGKFVPSALLLVLLPISLLCAPLVWLYKRFKRTNP